MVRERIQPSPFAPQLDLASGVPAYRQIIDQILGAIASGALRGGDQLPTVRQLAVDLVDQPQHRRPRLPRTRDPRRPHDPAGHRHVHHDAARCRPDEAVRQRQLDQLVGDAARPGRRGRPDVRRGRRPGCRSSSPNRGGIHDAVAELCFARPRPRRTSAPRSSNIGIALLVLAPRSSPPGCGRLLRAPDGSWPCRS